MLRFKHRPRPRPVQRARFGRLLKLGFFALGMPEHSFCSIDVTSRCNLRCKHCYFFEQSYGDELSVDQWVQLMEDLRRKAWPRPYFAFQCSWIGGEPLLRPEVIERCRAYFPFNIVVTNGTIPLPDWHDVHYFISVDGTREIHEALRGAGSYDKILRNADRSDLDVMVTCCINRLNAHCVEEFIRDWNATAVRHVAFEFHTPIQGLAAEDELTLSPPQRDAILDVLLELKTIYGHFILSPARAYRMMKSERCQAVTSNCIFSRSATIFGPDGQRKLPCMLGPKADCERCGCIIPFVTQAQVERPEIIRDLWEELKPRIPFVRA